MNGSRIPIKHQLTELLNPLEVTGLCLESLVQSIFELQVRDCSQVETSYRHWLHGILDIDIKNLKARHFTQCYSVGVGNCLFHASYSALCVQVHWDG